MEEDIGRRDGEDGFVKGEDGRIGERLDVLFAVSMRERERGIGSVTCGNVRMVALEYASLLALVGTICVGSLRLGPSVLEVRGSSPHA